MRPVRRKELERLGLSVFPEEEVMKARIVLADDHNILIEGLAQLLRPQYTLVETVGDGRALVAAVAAHRPDVAILDLMMPMMNGMEALQQMQAASPETKAVVLTQQWGKIYVQSAFRAGAHAYVLKEAAAAELLLAVSEVLEGRFYVTPRLAPHVSSVLKSSQNAEEWFGSDLTSRQREVLQLVAEGKAAKEIAYMLGISVRTVEFHKASIMEELGLRSTAALTRYAIENKIVSG